MHINRRTFGYLVAAAGMASSTASRSQPAPVTVLIEDTPEGGGHFTPQAVTIRSGESVTWSHRGSLLHTVTFDPSKVKDGGVTLPSGVAPFESGDLEQGGVYTHTFTVKGLYRYVCEYHAAMGMSGSVEVK